MMDKAEFDKFADEYYKLHKDNIRITGEDPEFFARYKAVDAARIFNEEGAPNENTKILDFGAGVGNSVPFLKREFGESKIFCADVSGRSLEIAKDRFPNLAEYRLFDGEKLPFQDDYFDLVFIACVFHHVQEDYHVNIMREIYRVLKIGGCVVLFEHNPLNFLTVKAVDSCCFDENAKLIKAKDMKHIFMQSGFDVVRIEYRVFFPRFLKLFRVFERFLWWLPLGGQYFICGKK